MWGGNYSKSSDWTKKTAIYQLLLLRRLGEHRHVLPVVTLSASVCLSVMALMTEIRLTFHGQFTVSGATLGLAWHILKPATSSKLERDRAHVLKRATELVKHLERRVIWIMLSAKAKQQQSNMKKFLWQSGSPQRASRLLKCTGTYQNITFYGVWLYCLHPKTVRRRTSCRRDDTHTDTDSTLFFQLRLFVGWDQWAQSIVSEVLSLGRLSVWWTHAGAGPARLVWAQSP